MSKLIKRLYSIIPKNQAFYDNFIKKYKQINKDLNIQASNRRFFSYAISRMHEYDLDSIHIKTGFARIGKSIDAIDIIRDFYVYRLEKPYDEIDNYIMDNKLITSNFIYSEFQEFLPNINRQKAQIFVFDEMYFAGDRRKSMIQKQINTTEEINAFADMNHTYLMLIQELSDLDMRFVNKSNSIGLLTERSKELLFAKEKNFTIMKSYYGFEKFIKEPNLLSNKVTGEHNLKKLPSYVYQSKWEDLQTKDELGNIIWQNKVFTEYLKNKKAFKDKYSEKSKKELEKVEKKAEVDYTEIDRRFDQIRSKYAP